MQKLQFGINVIIAILVTFVIMSCSNEQVSSSLERETLTPSTTSTQGSLPAERFPTYTPVPTVVEPGLAYGHPCKPPCWRGVVPGQSTSQEVSQAIEQIRAEGWAYYISGGPIYGYAIYPLPHTMQGSVHVKINNNIVEVIFGGVLFDYSISTAIEQFDSPEGIPVSDIVAKSYSGTCSSCDEWQSAKDVGASGLIPLLYPEQGLLFWVWGSSTGKGCLCPEMQINGFCYYEPLTMSEVLEDNYLADLCGLPALKKITEEDLVDWHGFGGGY